MKAAVYVLFLWFAGIAACPGQDGDRDTASKLMALERASLQACEAKDLNTLDAILDEAFVLVDADGSLQTKSTFLIFVQSADSLKYLTDDMFVRVHGNTAIVTGIVQSKAIIRGKSSLQRARFVDTWLFREGRWVTIGTLFTPPG